MLELGLSNKREGLEAMRRERLPTVRMYDIAEYYYKARPALTATLGCVYIALRHIRSCARPFDCVVFEAFI